jgi:di/tricarboxylate transporter
MHSIRDSNHHALCIEGILYNHHPDSFAWDDPRKHQGGYDLDNFSFVFLYSMVELYRNWQKCQVVLFLCNNLLVWKDIKDNFPWDVILLGGGSLALAEVKII